MGERILATQDGGDTWNPQNSGTERDLISVQFVSPETGWAVGLGGTILATLNGGETWKPQNSGTERDLFSVQIVSPETGWAVGDGETVLSIRSVDLDPIFQIETPDALQIVVRERDLPSDLRLNDQDLQLGQINREMVDTENNIDNLNQEIVALREASSQGDGLTPFLTTTVTRIGIVLLIIFLVSILVNLYRYNMRLAAFYSARADALGLADIFAELRLDELVTTMAPDSMDFGKMPRSPGEQAVSLAKEIVNAGKQVRS